MTTRFSFQEKRDSVAVTIANGASLSGAADLGSLHLLGIVMPAAWDAASLTFQVSPDGVTYQNLYDASSEVAYTGAAAARNLAFAVNVWHCWRYVKVRSGTAGIPVNQTADRVITLILGED